MMLDLSVGELVFYIGVLIIFEAFFTGSEIALLSADKIKLTKRKKEGDKGSKLALELVSHPERILSTTLLVTSLAIASISSLVAVFVYARGWAHSEVISILITSPVIVLFGELIPKTFFQRHSDAFAPWVARPVYTTYLFLSPITVVLSRYTGRVSKWVAPIETLITGKRRTTRDLVRNALTFSQRETEIPRSERLMISRILSFKDAPARKAMIPLSGVDAVEESATAKEALQIFNEHQHSRIPVYSERIDNIVGILESNSLFSIEDWEKPVRNLNLVRPVRYFPETQPLPEVFIELKKNEAPMGIVVDEHGAAVGILTPEDIAEEVVGEIRDEFDAAQTLIKQVDSKSWLIQAKTPVAELNETLRLEIPSGDYETMGGFLLSQFRRIPDAQDELYYPYSGGTLKFIVRKAGNRRIESFLLEVIPSSEN